MHMAPLPVVIPLAVAALLAGIGGILPRRAVDVIALATSALVLVVSVLLVGKSSSQIIVYWFGGWQPAPRSHFPVGICFMIDPIGAGLASLVALLVLAAFTFSWSYFESVKSLYHVLMLVFLASMCGLCLTGDLFNLFVWFELMTAAGVALCGYKSEESQSLQGALNFAVMNTVAAFLSLSGVALLYAFTGSLNMAEVGASLAASPPGGHFLIVAFLFVIAGFLVKAAIAPFHFWLADAHAVAPTPVCILFSGVMVELGLFAISRIYWVVFADVVKPAQSNIRLMFLVMGSLTAVVGALYCFGQRHLKRLLAFSTISHVGLMLLGFALLDPRALAGAAIYVIGHGMVKGSLFIGAGILLHRFGTVDEYDLRGKARRILPVGVMMVIGAWGLAGLPPFATFFGEKAIEKASGALHLGWLSAIAIFAEVLTGAAVLRFSARAFFNWGHGKDIVTRGAPHIHMDSETSGEHGRVPIFMWLPMAALLVGAALIAIPLRARVGVQTHATVFETARLYQAVVLQGTNGRPLAQPQPIAHAWPSWEQAVVALGIFGLPAIVLLSASRKHKFAAPLRAVANILEPLRPLQSGRVGDYVAWFALGIAVYGGLLLLAY
jgi:multicomponent Na+:H+ antiporter subunit D